MFDYSWSLFNSDKYLTNANEFVVIEVIFTGNGIVSIIIRTRHWIIRGSSIGFAESNILDIDRKYKF